MGAGGSCQGGLYNLLERQYYGLERKSGLSGGHLQGDRLVCTHSFEGLFWEESLCSAIMHLKERDGESHLDYGFWGGHSEEATSSLRTE